MGSRADCVVSGADSVGSRNGEGSDYLMSPGCRGSGATPWSQGGPDHPGIGGMERLVGLNGGSGVGSVFQGTGAKADAVAHGAERDWADSVGPDGTWAEQDSAGLLERRGLRSLNGADCVGS